MIGGSDAHTLRRIGTTWTEAPGATREQFMHSLTRGLGRPGGVHGGTAPVAGDAYGVVARYVSALAGFGPQDVRSWRRAGCLAFATVTLPFQLTPLVVAAARKSAERRTVREVTAALALPLRSPESQVSASAADWSVAAHSPGAQPQLRRDRPSSASESGLSSPESPVPSPESGLPIGASS
jgi:hypothetical protein